MKTITEEQYFAILNDQTRKIVERTSYGPGTMTTGLYDEDTGELLAVREVSELGTEYYQETDTKGAKNV